MAAAAAAAATEVDPGYTNHPDDEKAARGGPKSALWPGKVYNVLYQVTLLFWSRGGGGGGGELAANVVGEL